MRLPVIVGLGGVNSAGRLSAHHAFRRLVIDRLTAADAAPTWRSLAALMQLTDGTEPDAAQREHILAHTLLRRIEAHLVDVDAIYCQKNAALIAADGQRMRFHVRRRLLPSVLPDGWTISELPDRSDLVCVEAPAEMDVVLPDQRISRVQSGGQLPTGFQPDTLYQSRSHPRGLAMTVYGASDAVRSLGIGWDRIRGTVSPDEIAVYSGSSMSQLDDNGYAGMMQAPMIGKRTTAKQLPLGLPEMSADFVNAYVLGSTGSTGTNVGACATYLYNLRQGVEDIRSGRRRVVIVGNAEAPITPEVIEGYRTMGALAEDEALMKLDGRNDRPDYRRACRPFSDNCGFTLAESAVFTVLMDDELALELGASILGAVPEVHVNADGFKKSISGPGAGNYLTMAKAMAVTRAMLGEESLRRRTYVHAHGTGTPQNRVTESHILSTLAGTFGIDRWTVAAVKSYLGHSLGPAGGDQLATALGTFAYGIIPGITSIDHLAADVHRDRLDFPMDHVELGSEAMDAVLLNSKGFGGNNATGVVLAPHVTRRMLARRHGQRALDAWQTANETVATAAADYDAAMIRGELPPIYRFGEGVIEGKDLDVSADEIRVPGFARPVSLKPANPFSDMSD